MEDKMEKVIAIAEEVLNLSRNTLLVNLRFLDAALSQFVREPINESTMMTDGRRWLYNPVYVIQTFQKQQETVTRDYLHMVLHCVYRHMFVDPSMDRDLWDLACDIAVENTITDLGLKSTTCEREKVQQGDILRLSRDCSMMTAEKIYAFLKAKGGYTEALRNRFFADDHRLWYASGEKSGSKKQNDEKQDDKKQGSGDGQQDGHEKQDDGEARDGGEQQTEQSDASEQTSGSRSQQDETQSAAAPSAAELEEIWTKISERMQTDMMMFSNGRDGDAGHMLQNLKEVNREKYDYASFLKKFAVMGEAMKINDDEFDYIYYTYGMKLYDKMPLIEPLEYKEVKRIKEFVIAIDTSGSVIGELVQQFVQKTYNILKSTESFFSKINLHIIQSDTAIQEHVKITTQEEFDRYFKTMTLKGFGGNDEIQLFNYVTELVERGEFTNLKGMIYLTDGYGYFPQHKPDYEVAFVFVNDRYEIPEVPPWVIRLVLEPNDI